MAPVLIQSLLTTDLDMGHGFWLSEPLSKCALSPTPIVVYPDFAGEVVNEVKRRDTNGA